MLQDAAKIPYLCKLVHGEALRHFDMLYVDFEISTPLTLEVFFYWVHTFTIISLSKQNRAMHRGMRKPHGLKVRCYMAHLIGLNEYLPSFPGSKPTHKICMTELNEILLKSMPNSWSKQAYVQPYRDHL